MTKHLTLGRERMKEEGLSRELALCFEICASL
jgi:hypothetical protein